MVSQGSSNRHGIVITIHIIAMCVVMCKSLQTMLTSKIIWMFPYWFLASQTYSPLSVISAVKIITLSLLVCGQDKQLSGMDQLYTGSGEDDTVQLSTTCSLTFTIPVWFCSKHNSGGPTNTSLITLHYCTFTLYILSNLWANRQCHCYQLPRLSVGIVNNHLQTRITCIVAINGSPWPIKHL